MQDCFDDWNLGHLNLFRISVFGYRIWFLGWP